MNCLDCPFHSIIPDPDPYDSFCSDDIAVVCTKTLNPTRDLNHTYCANRSPFRAITVSCRPYNDRRESSQPSWCPRQAAAK